MKLRISEITRAWPSTVAAAATIVIGVLVYLDGQVPSAFTTLFFIAACAVITFSLLYKFPLNSGISFGIMLLGVPAYFIWARRPGSSSR